MLLCLQPFCVNKKMYYSLRKLSYVLYYAKKLKDLRKIKKNIFFKLALNRIALVNIENTFRDTFLGITSKIR